MLIVYASSALFIMGHFCGATTAVTSKKGKNGYKIFLEEIRRFKMKLILVEKGSNGEIDYDFYIGKYPVTQKQWKKIMGNNPSYFKGDNLPVEQVSWYDVIEYCNKRSEKEGLEKVYTYRKIKDNELEDVQMNEKANGYRLPTQKEWEYAARGGIHSKGYIYAGSNDIDEVAWNDDNSGDKTHKVGTKKANDLGIYDMSGNVWEWCWDRYKSSNRIRCGGSWSDYSDYCGVSYWSYDDYYYKGDNVGFRLCRSL